MIQWNIPSHDLSRGFGVNIIHGFILVFDITNSSECELLILSQSVQIIFL